MKNLLISFFIFSYALLSLASSARTVFMNGAPALENEAPWVVKIHYYDEHLCTGSLIGRKWILTAGHCYVDPNKTKFKMFGARSGSGNELMQLPALKQVFVHREYYAADPRSTRYDLALFELEEPVEYSKNLQAIPLLAPDSLTEVLNSSLLTIYAWGPEQQGEKLASPLTKIEVPALKESEFSDHAQYPYFKERPWMLNRHLLIAKNQEAITQPGDSGTGWTVLVDGKPYLAGVLSNGDGKSVTVASRPSLELLWIQEKTQMTELEITRSCKSLLR